MKRLGKKHVKRIGIDVAGFGLLAVSPFLGLLPGPGGVLVFAAGLGILSLNYAWAKNLLDNFEQKYKEFVDKYLVNNKKVARITDLLSLTTICIGLFMIFNTDHFIFRGFGIGCICFGFIVLISNQKRLGRFIKYLRKKF